MKILLLIFTFTLPLSLFSQSYNGRYFILDHKETGMISMDFSKENNNKIEIPIKEENATITEEGLYLALYIDHDIKGQIIFKYLYIDQNRNIFKESGWHYNNMNQNKVVDGKVLTSTYILEIFDNEIIVINEIQVITSEEIQRRDLALKNREHILIGFYSKEHFLPY